MRRTQDDDATGQQPGGLAGTGTDPQSGASQPNPADQMERDWGFGGTWNADHTKFTPPNGDWQSWFQNVVKGKAGNQLTLTQLKNVFQHFGVQLSPENAQHQITKIGLPDGSWVRVIEGDPTNGQWTWVPQPTGGAAGGASAGAYQPFNERFTPPAPFAPPGNLNLGGRPGLEFIPPAPQFNFSAPTMEQAAADPGYQFGLTQGVKARDQSAAQRGVLNTGGTLKGIDEFGQDYATQHYGDFYNRAFNLAQAKFSPVMTEWGTLASAGQRQNELNYNHAYDQYQTDYGHSWDRYLQDYRAWQDWQNMDWNRKFSLATA